jgi:endothelin-converting enzyme/putative endopeptidase
MRRHTLALVFVAAPLATLLAATQTVSPSSGVDLAALDRRVDACTDFYAFACGGWIAANPIAADRQRWGRFQEVQERNFAILRRILEAPGGEGDLRKARDYYAACMDQPAIDAKRLTPLDDEMSRIAGLTNRDGIPELVAFLQAVAGETPPSGSPRRAGMYVFFRLASRPKFSDATTETAALIPDGLGLPNRDYYLKTDDRSVNLREEYRQHVVQLFMLAGRDRDEAERSAAAVIAIETSLAAAMLDVAERRDPNAINHPMTLEDLQRLTPAFNWTRYLRAVGVPAFTALNVNEPEFMKAFNNLIASTTLPDLRRYFSWHLLHGASTRLSTPFEEATFDFFNRQLTGQNQQPPRWRECIADTDQQLGEALGRAFVVEAFPAQAKADILRMVQDIKAAMKRDIDEASWMAADTKTAAHLKLEQVTDRIGYPETWRDYSNLEVSRTDALGNLQRSLVFHNARRLAKIGRRVDRNEWSMTPPTVNAYYDSSANTINFPAGILQPPFYRSSGDAAANYGAIGAVIGHELTHGFDDQGRKYDAQGNLRDWWTSADAKAFEARAGCIADQYSAYAVAGDTKINGKLTLGENTADNGGLRLALMAYLARPDATVQATLDGFTPEQRVFLGWAQQWCESSRPEAERLKAATNPHSANQYRVNGVVSNMPEFQKAFSCRADTAMVRTTACRVW